MVVAVSELQLELDAAEERRRRVDDEAVQARLEAVGDLCPAVGVGAGGRDLLVAAVKLDRNVRGWFSLAGVEDVG